MKCQRCSKPATLHITEVLQPMKYDEFHFCEDCAKKYLYAPLPGKLGNLKGSDEEPGQKCCDECGIKFIEFRNTGRLGCPHDYEAFNEELVPLLESIHGDARHHGKNPQRSQSSRSDSAELAALRHQLLLAVSNEEYEEAARLRDCIQRLEAVMT